MTASISSGGSPTRFLFAMFQGSGNIPLILPIAAQLVARGHSVRVLAGPGVRRSRLPIGTRFTERIVATGALLVQFQEPETHPYEGLPPSCGIVRGWTPPPYEKEFQRARVAVWSPSWAKNVADELRREAADVVAADMELFGALAAAEAAGVPSAALMHNVPWRPTPGLPPRGPGFLPAHGPLDRVRDDVGNMIIRAVWAREALPAHNKARGRLGLRPLRSPFEQYDVPDRVLILTSRAFDFAARRLPPNVRYVGTPFDDAGVPPTMWEPPGRRDDSGPLVLVSLSTEQGQAAVMHRVLVAVASLRARVVVTLGPSLDASQFTAPPNVTFETFVPHAVVLPHVTAMVTQCGLGTTMKALAHGVPLVCIPIVGDQPDNAARVVARGAGVRLGFDAPPEQIRAAIQQILDEPSFRDGARRLGAAIAAVDGARTAADELERLAGKSPANRPDLR